jgi:hypothetical protein
VGVAAVGENAGCHAHGSAWACLSFVALLAAFNEIRHGPGFEKTDLGRIEFLWLNGSSGFCASGLVRAVGGKRGRSDDEWPLTAELSGPRVAGST